MTEFRWSQDQKYTRTRCSNTLIPDTAPNGTSGVGCRMCASPNRSFATTNDCGDFMVLHDYFSDLTLPDLPADPNDFPLVFPIHYMVDAFGRATEGSVSGVPLSSNREGVDYFAQGFTGASSVVGWTATHIRKAINSATDGTRTTTHDVRVGRFGLYFGAPGGGDELNCSIPVMEIGASSVTKTNNLVGSGLLIPSYSGAFQQWPVGAFQLKTFQDSYGGYPGTWPTPRATFDPLFIPTTIFINNFIGGGSTLNYTFGADLTIQDDYAGGSPPVRSYILGSTTEVIGWNG